MRGASSTTLLLTAGLLGAAIVVTYGLIRLMPERHVAASAAVEPLPAPLPSSAVVVAKRLIRRGEQIKVTDLATLPVSGPLPATAVTSPDIVIGRVAITDIAPYQLVLSDVITSDPARAGIASLIPPGFRAIQLRTTDEVAVGNFIRAGDHVDVVLVLPEAVLPTPSDNRKLGSAAEGRTLLSNVFVLAVGDAISDVKIDPETGEPKPERHPEPPHGVTLAMLPEQVNQFTLGRSLGQMFLTLRNPTDQDGVGPGSARLADLRGTAPQAGVPGKRGIELITGGQSHTIYSQSPGSPQAAGAAQ